MRELFCPACGRPMKLRWGLRSCERFYGCTGWPECRGIISAYPDGGVRNFRPHDNPRIEAKMLKLKQLGAERIEGSRRAGRIDASTDTWLNLLLADADNLVELGEAQAIVRKGT